MALTLELLRECLNNGEDVAGHWQIEGGQVPDIDKRLVGNYSSVKRVSCSTRQQDTIFLLGTTPPENITLDGAHGFTSGGEAGSVSAASGAMAVHIGHQFARVNTVTIV
ncbi:MAG TPA: hypothetical protein VMF65_07940 [Acidimicrobiales bacterium]|nr:hypothetical protein [Acidimicrobiales bacterium]